MEPRSIRFRLTVWYAAVLFAALALFGGLTWFSLRHRLMTEIDRDLEGRTARFEQYFRAESSDAQEALEDELYEFCQALPPDSSIIVHGEHGFSFRYPQNGAPKTADLRIRRREFTVNGEKFQLEAGEPASEVQHTLDQLRLLLFSFIPAVILIASLGGAWLSRRALKPVDELAEAARSISIQNLSRRLPVPPTRDEIARLTEVLNSMLDGLERAVKTLSQFAADASHELRTPLSVIRTTAELALRRARPAEAYRASIQEIAAEAERMTRLVEDLLVLARSDTGPVEMPFEPVDLSEILRDVCAEMRSLTALRKIRIRAVIGEEAAMATGNRAALHRLFVVLLDNAVKYSRDGGEVLLALKNSADRITVAVEDFGPGIPAADLPHIFKRFYRANGGGKDGGHGLGLSLAESIARMHGAQIEVRSREGEGSRFEVKFARAAVTRRDTPAGAVSRGV